jgi:hypothetical protein
LREPDQGTQGGPRTVLEHAATASPDDPNLPEYEVVLG